MASVWEWSKTPSDNANSDPDINFAEGQAPGTVNNSARAVMAAVANMRDDLGGGLTMGGTATAYTLSTNQGLTTMAAGVRVHGVCAAGNSGSATLNVDTLGAKKIQRPGPLFAYYDIEVRDMAAGGHYIFEYDPLGDSSAGAWIILNPEPSLGSIIQRTVGTYATSADLTAAIPVDDTLPLIGEGTQIISVSMTPRSTVNRFRARFSGFGANTAAGNYTVASLHLNGGSAVAVSLHESRANNIPGPIAFEYEWAPGVTTSQTIAVRAGPSAGTSRMNGTGAGRLFGGAAICTLVVEEIRQ